MNESNNYENLYNNLKEEHEQVKLYIDANIKKPSTI